MYHQKIEKIPKRRNKEKSREMKRSEEIREEKRDN